MCLRLGTKSHWGTQGATRWSLNKIKLCVAIFATASTAAVSIYNDEYRLRRQCAGPGAIRSNAKSLSYDKSCCLHLFVSIEPNDSDFRLREVTLARFDRTNDIVRIPM